MLFILLTATPTLMKAQEKTPEIVTSTVLPVKSELTNSMELRLNEINSMDKSKLSKSEKRALKKEVKAIKKASGGGIYISAGAIIIIILLIILL